MVRTIARDDERYTWVAAAIGARSASAYQLALDEPVLAIGGYKGTDPTPTLGQFQSAVESGRIHWLITGGTEGAASQADRAAGWRTGSRTGRRRSDPL